MPPGSTQDKIKQLEKERDQLLKENEKLKLENKVNKFSINHAPQMVSYVDRSLTYRFINKQYQKIFNISAGEIIGKKLPSVIGKKAFEKAQHYVNRVLNGEEVRYLEKYEYPDKTKFIDGHLIPDINEKGEVYGWFAFLNDITEYMERGWRKHDEQYTLLAKNLKEELWVADTNFKLTWISPYCENILGYTAEERLSMNQEHIFGKKAMNRFRVFIKTQKNRDCKKHNHQKTISTQLKARHKNGKNIWVEVKAWFFCNTAGEIIGVQGITKDLHQEKLLQEKLVKSENRFKTIFKEDLLVKLIIDPGTGNITDANKAAARFYGYPLDVLLTMKIQQINQQPDEKTKKEMQKAFQKKQNIFNFKHKLANGKLRDVEVYSNPMQFENKTYLFSIIKDVTSIKMAEQKLKDSEEKYRDIFENSPLGMFRSTPPGKFIEANPAFAKMLGYNNLNEILQNIYDIGKQVYADPKQRKKVLEATSKSTQVKHFETIFKRKDGSKFIVNLFLKPVLDKEGNTLHFEGIVEDISEQREMQKSIKQLTADSLYINEKNKIVSRLKKQVKTLFDKYDFPGNEKEKVERLFQKVLDIDKDWQQIKTHFEMVHKGFYEKLGQKSSHLTQNELRHCTYIKMNFSTKEIARLMNVKDTSIQRARVRLKKKLALKKQDSLFTFIHNI